MGEGTISVVGIRKIAVGSFNNPFSDIRVRGIRYKRNQKGYRHKFDS